MAKQLFVSGASTLIGLALVEGLVLVGQLLRDGVVTKAIRDEVLAGVDRAPVRDLTGANAGELLWIDRTPNLRKDEQNNAINRVREHTESQALPHSRPSARTALGRSLACSSMSSELSAPTPEKPGPQRLRRPRSANHAR